jgi:hypothetical protein
LVAQIFRRPCQLCNQEACYRRANGTKRWDQQHTRRIAICNEIFEVRSHRPDIPRNEDPAGAGGNLQNRWIGSAVWNDAGRTLEIDGRLPAPQTSPDVRIEVRVSLKGKSSSEIGGPFVLDPLKALDHVGRHGISRLDLLENTLLVLEVSVNVGWVLQEERDSAINLRQ